jgi:hypothetical protein
VVLTVEVDASGVNNLEPAGAAVGRKHTLATPRIIRAQHQLGTRWVQLPIVEKTTDEAVPSRTLRDLLELVLDHTQENRRCVCGPQGFAQCRNLVRRCACVASASGELLELARCQFISGSHVST